MKYSGHIIYDLYNILGNKKINVDYDVEGWGNKFEITKISISPCEPDEYVPFNFEDEIDQIVDQCKKDFEIQQELMDIASHKTFKMPDLENTKVKLAHEKYDFSAN